MSMNVYGIGNLGEDAEVIDLAEGAKLLTFSLAVDSDFKEGEQKVTNWHDAALRVKNDPTGLLKILKKGCRIFVKKGTWEIRSKEKKGGGKVYYHNLRISEFDLVKGPKDLEAEAGGTPATAKPGF